MGTVHGPTVHSQALFAWGLLALTILLEVSGTTCMKLSNGFEKTVPSIFVFVSYIACFSCLTYAMKFWQSGDGVLFSISSLTLQEVVTVPFSVSQSGSGIVVSTAYALWSGLGTAITAVIGTVVFNESMSLMKLTGLILIVLGVVILNLAGR